MTTRERIGEYAVLKTLGFGAWRIAGLIFGESLVITIMGGLFGMLFTFPRQQSFRELLGTYFPRLHRLEADHLPRRGAALPWAVRAAVIPIWRAIRIRIADGLRRIG